MNLHRSNSFCGKTNNFCSAIIFFAFGIFFQNNTAAQPYFIRYDSVPVTINNNLLKYPWAGGLNSCQFSTIDLNRDGKEDLFIFDRGGNRINTFINNGTAGNVDYRFAPEYRSHFVNQHDDRVQFHDWILLRDYDMDGKKDIFTYSSGATAVYRNTTQTADSLTFELKTSFLKSFYDPADLALFISPVDMPTFIDVDNDGDLDVLTFHIFGTVIEYHSNQSQELYGNSDSLVYRLQDRCWGGFSENQASNSVHLDTCIGVFFNDTIHQQQTIFGGNRHSGSSTLALDINDDGVKEFILGDLSFKNLTLLYNDGTLQDAHIFDQHTAAPPGTTPVDIAIFPAAFYEDVNNDGAKDLIVSPNATNITENFNSVWFYKNNGTTSLPQFEFVQNNFMQDNMIEVGEVSYPVFFDVNADGLIDLIIGNYGYYHPGNYTSNLSYYENTGTPTEPAFRLITRDFAGIEALNASGVRSPVPTFGDIDADGIAEMIIGDAEGRLHLFKNNAPQGQQPNYLLSQANYFSIDVGQNATPQLFDVDGDSLLDLVIGERNARLKYYRNIGTANAPDFMLVTNEFGGVDVRKQGFNVGYSVPFLFRMNNQLQLFCGTESGDIIQFTDIEETLAAAELLSVEIGQGNTVSTDAETTPFGSQFKNGRNRFLFKAEELQAGGFQNGVIKSMAFHVHTPAGTGSIVGMKIGFANTDAESISDFNYLMNFTNMFFSNNNDVVIENPGWIEFQFTSKFTWDGISNLAVEICFDTTITLSTNSSVYCSSTPFTSNVAASADNVNGCTMNSTVSGTLRPNVRFSLQPTFRRKGTLALYEGVRTSLNGADLDNDGYMDIVIGNYAGGVSYYKGDTTGITTTIKRTEQLNIKADLFPNPCNENFNLVFQNPLEHSATIEIFSITGQLLLTSRLQRGENKFTCNTAAYSPGIYLLKASTKSGYVTKKIVVSR